MKKKLYIALTLLLCLSTSCNDWLDVKSETEEKEDDLFETYEGFRSALTGCYMSMGSQDIYGEKLTMTDIECLANLWYKTTASSTLSTNYYLQQHDYESDDAVASIKAMYSGLFNVITQANVVLKHVQEGGEVIKDETVRSVIEGEAYALRAYCQFDLLRLFGQVPVGGTTTVELPYSYTTSLDEMPAYYSFEKYVENLKADITKAEELLKANDPLSTNKDSSDDFMENRTFRLNYWAVVALHARMALYLGEKTQAYNLAMSVINAKEEDGDPKFELSGTTDLASGVNRYALPGEGLFKLSKYDLKSYTVNTLIGYTDGTSSLTYDTGSRYLLNGLKFRTLFEGVNTASDNRYISVWNKNIKNVYGSTYYAIQKYWYADNAEYASYYHKFIPMLRLSEMYLIATETAPTLAESNNLYATYQRSHAVLLTSDAFADEAALKDGLLAEYRREFFAEGQMFFTYKRLNSATILWKSPTAATEADYVLPLPNTEYNPN